MNVTLQPRYTHVNTHTRNGSQPEVVDEAVCGGYSTNHKVRPASQPLLSQLKAPREEF